jgi:hypothetical protein
MKRGLLLGLLVVSLIAIAMPVAAKTNVERGTFAIPEDIALVPDPGMLDAVCSLGTYVMVDGVLDYKAKYRDDGSRQSLVADWIDSTWELLETGELYGLTARSAADFKWVLDSTGENIIKGKGYWVMEWYDLSTGEITDYIRGDFDAMEGDATC